MPTPVDWREWEARFERFLEQPLRDADAGHDLGHIHRVVAAAKRLAASEGAQLEVVVPAAWLHDCVTLSKDSPRRRVAATEAAQRAGAFLRQSGYPPAWIPAIRHAIEAHSFSTGLSPATLEARVVQDADRLDALGAIGIARCLMVGCDLGLPLYDANEPFPRRRRPDDSAYVVDHFYCKLLELADGMQTVAGREEAKHRTRFMQAYLSQLGREIGFAPPET